MDSTIELKKPTKEEQLLQLKDMTARLQILHEAQVIQLRWWFMCLADHCLQYEIQVDIENKLLVYKITKTTKAPRKDIRTRLKMLDYNIKWLLGDKWVLKVCDSKKILYSGKIGAVKLPKNKQQKNG